MSDPDIIEDERYFAGYEVGLKQGREIGAAEMREKAATLIEQTAYTTQGDAQKVMHVLQSAFAADIRALPIDAAQEDR